MIFQLIRRPVVWVGRTFFECIVASGITPNQITLAGLALVLANCGAYLWYKDPFVLGVGLALSYPLDALDGAVARRQGKVTPFGGYLDAVIDRYQEVCAYFVVGLVTGWWAAIFLLTVGSMLVSYTKAAAALHASVSNKGWPGLMERIYRGSFFCTALILDNVVPLPAAVGGSLLHVAIWYFAIVVHFTAVQRILGAHRMLTSDDSVPR